MEDYERDSLWRDVLDHGHVALIEYSPSDPDQDMVGYRALDLSVANAARVSLGNRSKSLTERDMALIDKLMEGHHGTPFEHQVFTWRVKLPIMVEREWVRHRTASTSEISARYVQLDSEGYVPALGDIRRQVGSSMSYTYEPMEESEARIVAATIREQNEMAFAEYEAMIDRGVAKEVARLVLPVATYTEKVWTVNARNLMGFLTLRNAPQAQLEIRRYAEAMEAIWAQVMPVTADAYVRHGRVKP